MGDVVMTGVTVGGRVVCGPVVSGELVSGELVSGELVSGTESERGTSGDITSRGAASVVVWVGGGSGAVSVRPLGGDSDMAPVWAGVLAGAGLVVISGVAVVDGVVIVAGVVGSLGAVSTGTSVALAEGNPVVAELSITAGIAASSGSISPGADADSVFAPTFDRTETRVGDATAVTKTPTITTVASRPSPLMT